MKRKILLFFAALIYLSAMAQDIIVTKKAERIEALITEVSSTEIRYKKWNYQDGPVFVAQTSDLSAIIYKNGEVQVFNNKAEEKTATKEVATNSNVKSRNTKGIVEELPRFTYKKVPVEGKKRPKYRYVSEDGRIVLTEDEFLNLLKETCYEAYEIEQKALRLSIVSCVFILIPPVGLILSCCAISKSGEVLPAYNSQCAGEAKEYRFENYYSGD